MKLFLFVLAISLGALAIVTPAESEVCYDGCASISLSVGDYVILTNPSTGSNCSACGSGNVTLFNIQKVDNCGYCTAPTCPTGTFCTAETPSVVFVSALAPEPQGSDCQRQRAHRPAALGGGGSSMR